MKSQGTTTPLFCLLNVRNGNGKEGGQQDRYRRAGERNVRRGRGKEEGGETRVLMHGGKCS